MGRYPPMTENCTLLSSAVRPEVSAGYLTYIPRA